MVDTDGDTVADAFLSDFSILNPIAAVTYDGWAMPLTLSGEYIFNTGARGGRGGAGPGYARLLSNIPTR